MTPRNLIRSALRAINALGVDGTPTADQHNDALELLNLMLDSWSIEELLPFDYVQENFTLTALKTNYTIGDATDAADADGIGTTQTPTGAGASITLNGAEVVSGVAVLDVPRHITIYSGSDISNRTLTFTGTNTYGDTISETITGPNNTTVYGKKQFKTVTTGTITNTAAGAITVGMDSVIDTRRPIMIVSAFVRDSTGVDYPCYPSTRERYNTWTDKDSTTTSGSEITALYYDRTYPCGEIYIYKTPSVGTFTLFMDMWQPFKQIASTDIDTAINLPQSFMLPLRWNLAAELAPEYGKNANLNKTVLTKAVETKEAVKMVNTRQPKPTMLSTPVSTVMGQPAVNRS